MHLDCEVMQTGYLASLEKRMPEQITEEHAIYSNSSRPSVVSNNSMARYSVPYSVSYRLTDLTSEGNNHNTVTSEGSVAKPAMPTVAVAQPAPRWA